MFLWIPPSAKITTKRRKEEDAESHREALVAVLIIALCASAFRCFVVPSISNDNHIGGTKKKRREPRRSTSKEIDSHHHLLKKEEGFKTYFRDKGKSNDVIKIDIRQIDTKAIYKAFDAGFKNNKDIKIVFVTNSRVVKVAQ